MRAPAPRRPPVPGPSAPRRVSTGALPDPEHVLELLSSAHERIRHVDDGTLADYIPALAEAPPGAFGACVAGVGGSVVSVGDARTEFSIQSVSKPFVFALVCEAVGHEVARERLGANSTGLPFNSVMAIELSEDRIAPSFILGSQGCSSGADGDGLFTHGQGPRRRRRTRGICAKTYRPRGRGH